MKRRAFVFTTFLLMAACGGREGLDTAALQRVGEWTLADSSRAGEQWTARYQGTPEVRVTLTRKASQTEAFSAVQSWRAEAGKMAFYRGRYFGIAESPGAAHAELARFSGAFEKLLPQ